MYSKTLLIRFIRLDLLEQGGQENHRASCMVTVANNQRQNLYKFSILLYFISEHESFFLLSNHQRIKAGKFGD